MYPKQQQEQPSSQEKHATLVVVNFKILKMQYDENNISVQNKLLSKINDGKQYNFLRLLVPKHLSVQLISKSKMLCLQLKEKPLSLSYLTKEANIEFTNLQIIQAAICGISSLSDLHSLNLVHGRINSKTCYFYNKQRRVPYKKRTKIQKITEFGIALFDTDKFQGKIHRQTDRIQQLLFQPISQALGLKTSFKDDLQSLIYVLVRMATGQAIFSKKRLQKSWRSQQRVRKWKIHELYQQMAQKIPKQLLLIMKFYLRLQQTSHIEKPDYSSMLKQLVSQKEKYLLDEILEKQQIIKEIESDYCGQNLGAPSIQRQGIAQQEIKLQLCQKTQY